MSGVDSVLEMSGLPFDDARFLILFILFFIVFAILFFIPIKNLMNKNEKKELDLFLNILDNYGLDHTKKKIIKIFTIVGVGYGNGNSLGFALKDGLSVEDKQLLESFRENEKYSTYFSENFKNFKSKNIEEFKTYKKILRKFNRKSFGSNFLVIGIVLLIQLILIVVLSLFLNFYFKIS